MFRFETGVPFSEPSSGVDLKFHYCGTIDCDAGSHKGPVLWDHWRLHYLQEGQGTLTVEGRSWNLRSGDCFIVAPGVRSFYRPASPPWNYHWVAFSGLNASPWLRRAGLTSETPVRAVPDGGFVRKRFETMYEVSIRLSSGDLRLLAELLQVLAYLMDTADLSGDRSRSRTTLYVNRAVEWMELHFSRPIRISDLVTFIGLDPKYFSRLFKTQTGMSPQEFLIDLRMRKAVELLENTGLTVGDVARSVGYPDPLQFSKMFKKIRGFPPSGNRMDGIGAGISRVH